MSNIILKPVSSEIIEKKSRFIGFGEPFFSLAEFEKRHGELKKRYSDANHVAWAYRIQSDGQVLIKFSDDGEVSGTAGKPIYNHIEGNDLINSAIFVVRYFGGIKLGAGGLVRAYGKAAKEIIQTATIEKYIKKQEIVFEVGYDQQKSVEYQVNQYNGEIVDREFQECVKYRIIIACDLVDTFMAEVKPTR